MTDLWKTIEVRLSTGEIEMVMEAYANRIKEWGFYDEDDIDDLKDNCRRMIELADVIAEAWKLENAEE